MLRPCARHGAIGERANPIYLDPDGPRRAVPGRPICLLARVLGPGGRDNATGGSTAHRLHPGRNGRGDAMTAPLTPGDRLGLRILGTKLAGEGRWIEAIGPLEAALNLYRQGAGASGSPLAMRDGDLIDQATVLSRLLACYFAIGGPDPKVAVPTSGDGQPADDAYGHLLRRLADAVDTWYWLGAEAFRQRRASELLQQFIAEQTGLLDMLCATGARAATIVEAEGRRLPLSNRQRAALREVAQVQQELTTRLVAGVEQVRRLVGQLAERQIDPGQALEVFRNQIAALGRTLGDADERMIRGCVDLYERYGQLGDAAVRLPNEFKARVRTPDIERSATPLDDPFTRKFDLLGQPSSIDQYTALRPLLDELEDAAAGTMLRLVGEEGASFQAAIDREVAEVIAASRDVPKAVCELFDVHLGMRILLGTIAISLDGMDQLARQALEQADARSQEVVQAAADLGGWLERWRARLVTDVEKVLAMEQGQPFFLGLVTTLLRLGAPAQALVASETARARAFADLLSADPLNSDVAASTQGEGTNDGRLASLASAPPVSTEDVFATVRDLRPTSGSDDQSQEGSRVTERRVVLVEYFTIEDGLLVFGVHAGLSQPEVVHLPLDQEQFRSFVITNFGGHDKVWEFLAAELADELWHEAYDYLIEPIGRWAAPQDCVYLVPHGFLHYLPLHALRLEGQYLIERNPVLYGPSASVLRLCQQRRKNSANGQPARSVAAVFGDALGDLPFARGEAERVAELFGVVPWLGDRVTVDAFRAASLGADIVHIAGHARFEARQPLDSGLRLAGDHLLTAREIFAEPQGLHAHLVTLSGCETGVNEHRPGDELIGLTRALLFAGTPSVLVSLWRVADNSTAFLMEHFYRLLREHPDMFKVDALRQAMLATKGQPHWDSFYHWAPFVLVGDWQ
jgi:hypothetical protein